MMDFIVGACIAYLEMTTVFGAPVFTGESLVGYQPVEIFSDGEIWLVGFRPDSEDYCILDYGYHPGKDT